VLEAVIDTYRHERRSGEHFIDTARRIGPLPFRAAADAVRRTTASHAAAAGATAVTA
jgi:sulfite reductase (NADPH) hemoprotein beta-component